MTKTEYRQRKIEANRPMFKQMVWEYYGGKCAICGADGEEQHHIIPLSYGGKNEIGNVILLCHRCHLGAHAAREIKHLDYGGGRPRKEAPEGYEEALRLYFSNAIGKRELVQMLGLPKDKMSDYWWYRKYVEDHNIPKDFKNTISWREGQEKKQRTYAEKRRCRVAKQQ